MLALRPLFWSGDPLRRVHRRTPSTLCLLAVGCPPPNYTVRGAYPDSSKTVQFVDLKLGPLQVDLMGPCIYHVWEAGPGDPPEAHEGGVQGQEDPPIR